MPICGVVMTTKAVDLPLAKAFLAGLTGVELHGADAQGNIVAVFDTQTAEEMERLMERVNGCPSILHAGVTYLNMEDVLMEPQPGQGR